MFCFIVCLFVFWKEEWYGEIENFEILRVFLRFGKKILLTFENVFFPWKISVFKS